MSYQVFARKYRPLTFDDVLGQDHVVRTLKNAIEHNRLAHAYLFVGPRGTGKTSTARIFAKALNCSGGPKVDFDPHEDICEEIAEGRSLDVLEIDGASNRGIDHIRDLRDNVRFAPSRGNFRIVYIDEVHMLTKESFNALLKTLEEPPPHVKFIFATTEPHKILPTILSRCQRFDLRPIPSEIIAEHLLHIASAEGVSLSREAAFAVAKVADGGMRDAQSMLDQLVSFCGDHIEEQQVQSVRMAFLRIFPDNFVSCSNKAPHARKSRYRIDLIRRQSAFFIDDKDVNQMASCLFILYMPCQFHGPAASICCHYHAVQCKAVFACMQLILDIIQQQGPVLMDHAKKGPACQFTESSFIFTIA